MGTVGAQRLPAGRADRKAFDWPHFRCAAICDMAVRCGSAKSAECRKSLNTLCKLATELPLSTSCFLTYSTVLLPTKVLQIAVRSSFLLLGIMPSDWWDDFFNNLATDLAPLVSLFGESPTKQFLSESVSPIDIFIFAMAPLGIITIVVSAIRVGGSPSLRAFIGRAQEGGGNIEAELCSSTSRDVCEMYNNGGIARVLGRPKILEIVHDPHADMPDFYGLGGKEKSAGIYSFEGYIKSGNGNAEWDEVTSSQNIPRLRKTAQEEPESHRSHKDAVTIVFAPHPNLSLNVGIKKRSAFWFFLAAVLGVFLQSGVLIFAGLSVFTYSERFKKDDKPADAYAFPFTLAGTLFLCIGVGMCGHIVERSTRERFFRRKSTTSKNGARSRLFWIQPGNQVIGDQIFDPFAYNETPGASILEYTTSGKNTQDKELQRTNNILVWVFVPITIFGFILQFVGLRALHSTISIAQLGATLLMSIIRSMLRTERLKKEDNRLGDDPDLFQGHELDWFAMELYKDHLKDKLGIRKSETQQQVSAKVLPHITNDNAPTFIWQVTTCPAYSRTAPIPNEKVYAQSPMKEIRMVSRSIRNGDADIVLLSGFRTVPKSDSSNPTCEDKEIHQWLAEAQQRDGTGAPRLVPSIFLSRARVARMTGVDRRLGSSRGDSNQWAEDVISARKLAATLAEAIRKTANALFGKYTSPPVLADKWTNTSDIFIALDCTAAKLSIVDGTMYHNQDSQTDNVYISLSRTSTDLGENNGQWSIDTSEIEAILSLWMWSLRIRSLGPIQTSTTEGIDDHSSLPKRMDLERLCSTRLLFVSEAEAAGSANSNVTLHQSTLSPWLGDLRTKVRRARLRYPTTSGFDPIWVWALNVDGKQQTSDQAIYSPVAIHQLQRRGISNDHDWFFGWDNFIQPQQQQQQQQSNWDLDALIMRTTHSSAVMCAQEIYIKLFRNLLTILEDVGGEKKVMRGRHGFYLANDNITEIIRAFTDSGLGSENDARACIIPALLEKNKLPVISMVPQARDLGDEYRREGAWEKAEEVLRWAFDTSLQSWKSSPPAPEEQTDSASTSTKVMEPTKRQNDPERELWLCVVALCECYRWALFCEGKTRQFGIQGIIQMLKLRENLPHLRDTLDIYGKVALRVAKESSSGSAAHNLSLNLENLLGNFQNFSSTTKISSSGPGEDNISVKSHESSQENPKENVLSAIKKGDMSAALYYLRGPSAIQEDPEGRSSLSWAAEKGWFIVVKSLIEVGATARQSDTFARTPLYFAASSGDKYLVEYLLEQGVDVNSRDVEHRTPLFMAVEHGHNEIVKMLLKVGANVNAIDKQKRSPLHVAAFAGNNCIVASLLEEGADVNCRSGMGDTPLITAAEHGHNDVLEVLLRGGAEANSFGGGMTALFCATSTRNIEGVRCLLRWGAKVTTCYSPLSIAIRCNSKELINLLLEAGADPNYNAGNSRPGRDYVSGELSPLENATRRQMTDVAEKLLQYGADPNIDLKSIRVPVEVLKLLWEKFKEQGFGVCSHQEQFLKHAIELDCLDIVEWFATQPGFEIYQSGLFTAMERRNKAMFEVLLACPRAPVNKLLYNETLLTEASRMGIVEVVKILLADPRVDIDLKDGYGKTAESRAEENGYNEILEILKQERERRRHIGPSESTGL